MVGVSPRWTHNRVKGVVICTARIRMRVPEGMVTLGVCFCLAVDVFRNDYDETLQTVVLVNFSLVLEFFFSDHCPELYLFCPNIRFQLKRIIWAHTLLPPPRGIQA